MLLIKRIICSLLLCCFLPVSLQAGGVRPVATQDSFLDVPLLLNGRQEVTIRDYLGKPTIVHVWATGCGYCRREMPNLDGFTAVNQGNITVLPIAIPYGNAMPVHRYYQRAGLDHVMNLYDPQQQVHNMLGERGIPYSYFLSPTGEVLDVVNGIVDWDSPRVIQAINALYDLPSNSLQQSSLQHLPY